jgi:23S rRNA pseudouridine1911/1915/1917 synthase
MTLPELIYISKNAVAVKKPVGMPSQSDPSGDKDLMSATSDMLSALGEDPRLWLIHRLDRNVGGVVIFARNKESAAYLSELVSGEGIGKRYLAVTDGVAREGEYRCYLYKDNATSKAYVVKTARKGAKEAVLNVTRLAQRDGKSLLSVKLSTGRFHQIRAQLSAEGTALTGDKKYGSRDRLAKVPSLFACELSLKLFDEEINVSALPDTEKYPWSIFAANALSTALC